MRNQFGAWEKALNEHRRPDRFMITSEWIIISLLEAIDNYIQARLQNIGMIYDFSVKLLQVLFFEILKQMKSSWFVIYRH